MQFTIERSYFTSIFPAASLIFSTFASDRPLMLHKALRVVIWIPFTVQIPTDFIFLMSAIFCGHRRGEGQRDAHIDNWLFIWWDAVDLRFKHPSNCMSNVVRLFSSLLRIQGALCVNVQHFFRCAVYSQSHVSVGGQCLGRRTPVRIREKENLHEIVAEQ